MSSKYKSKILKKNGSVQRRDVELSLAIVSALRNLIFSGKTIYPKSGQIEYIERDSNRVKTIKKVSKYTIMSWLSRGNVIPETGETLKDVLDKIREQYRTKKDEDMRQKLLQDTNRELNGVLNIPTNIFLRDKFGNRVIDENTGEYIRKEDHHLLKIKVDTAKHVAERLDPLFYGKNIKREKPLSVFSLADLRRAKIGKEDFYK